MERLCRTIDDDDKNLAIISGLSPEYDVERRMLEDDDDELTRPHIEKVISNQYKRLQEQKPQASAKALTVAMKGAAERCQLCHKRRHCPPVQ